MKCRECKWIYSNETMGSLYICVNGKSENFGSYTGLCSEDECEDGEALDEENQTGEDQWEIKDIL